MLPLIEIPNENYWKEKSRQGEKNSPNTPSPSSVTTYFMHGSGLFTLHPNGARLMRFDNLKRGIWRDAASSRDDFIGSYGGGRLRDERLSDRYALIADRSNITQEQIDFIREIGGGTVTLSRVLRDFAGESLPLHFYFISNGFVVNDE